MIIASALALAWWCAKCVIHSSEFCGASECALHRFEAVDLFPVGLAHGVAVIEVMEEVELIELLLVQVLDIAIDLLCLDVDFIFFNEYLVILLFAVFLQLLLVSFSGAMPTIGCHQAYDVRVDLWSIRTRATEHLLDAL